MKDEHDTKTSDIFPAKKQLKKPHDFVRLHIEKPTKQGSKKSTISIEVLSYEFLSLKLGEEPYTREANQEIKTWLAGKMEEEIGEGTLDLDAPYSFSTWLKKAILWELVSEDISKKWWNNVDV